MSLKGGYQIINLKNLEFNSEMGNSERYKDIYFNMVNSHAKMIIVSGLNMDGVKYNDYEVIFHEERPEGEDMYFQAVARRIWDTVNRKCITKYINIFSDDRVTCTQSEFIYETLPDSELSLDSTNALQNKVITENINRINGKIVEVENVNTLQDLSIANNTNEISRNAVKTALINQANISNTDNNSKSSSAYIYKYSNGLMWISTTLTYVDGDTFFNKPIKEISISSFDEPELPIIKRGIVISSDGKATLADISYIDDSLVIRGFEGSYLSDNITKNTLFSMLITNDVN